MVVVEECATEIRGASLPGQVQVFDEKARGDHPRPVVHGARRLQFSHSGVDEDIRRFARN